MSDFGGVMDRLLWHAQQVDSDYVTERGVTLVENLNKEDFPHVFAYSASETVSQRDFQQEDATGRYPIVIVTIGETQEELLTRVDAYRAQVEGDRTLNDLVDNTFISSVEIFEDARRPFVFAEIIVTTETSS